MHHAKILGFPSWVLGSPDDFEFTENPRPKRIVPKAEPLLTRGARLRAIRSNKRKPKLKQNTRADYRARQARRVLKQAIAEVFRGDADATITNS
jgi:hypothetical protein